MSIEFAVIERLDLTAQRTTPPGLDDAMGTPFMNDSGNGVGARVRPTTTIILRAKVSSWSKEDEQVLDQVGNDPDSALLLTLYEEDLLAAVPPLLVNGVLVLKPDDRLLRLENSDGILASDGTIRVDFTRGGTIPGLRCYEVKPGLTGERVYTMFFESQRQSASGLGA